MIQLENTKIELSLMGLFTSNKEWIHRPAVKKTYEMICVTAGTVYICEDENYYELKKGDILVLRPNISHKGYKISSPPVSFYWIHFHVSDESIVQPPFLIHDFTNTALFKELIHYGTSPEYPQYMKESVFVHILTEATAKRFISSALVNNVVEWVRINAGAQLTVRKTAENFGYNDTYLSKLINKHYGMPLKTLISRFTIARANDYLCNTNYSVKEISSMLEFSSPNAFINFYKYHENTTPTKFRNAFSHTLMNNK